MHDPLSGILLALTIVIGVGVFIFIVVLLLLAGTLLHTRKRLHEMLDHYQTEIAPHIGPMVKSAHSLIDDISPKLKHVTSNMVEASDMMRSQTQHISVSLSDMVERTHQQAARVDNIVSSTLNGIGHATAAVQEGISAPLRHLSGVLDGLRAGIGSFRRKRPHSNGTQPTVIVRKVDQDPY
jgi:ABC-type lipoprotein release transport system permease subunit